MASESSFSKRFRKHAPGAIFTRHEDMVSEGVPDLSYCFRGINGWIEVKQVDEWWPKRSKVIHTPFRKSQAEWIARRYAYGGPMFGLCQVGDTEDVVFVGPRTIIDLDVGPMALEDFQTRSDVLITPMRALTFPAILQNVMVNGLVR